MSRLWPTQPEVGKYEDETFEGRIEYALFRLGVVGPLATAEDALEALDWLVVHIDFLERALREIGDGKVADVYGIGVSALRERARAALDPSRRLGFR